MKILPWASITGNSPPPKKKKSAKLQLIKLQIQNGADKKSQGHFMDIFNDVGICLH